MYFVGKKGKCPYTKVPENCPVVSFEECQVDKDCSGDKKCCQNGCDRRCIGPRQGKSLLHVTFPLRIMIIIFRMILSAKLA